LGDVDVWWIDLDRIADGSPSVLAHDERVRAERFRSPRDRARWISARVALRQVLTGYTGMMPAQLQLTRGTHGKPALAGESSLRFNLAHAGERAVLAVTWDREVGVDLEAIDPCLDVMPLLAVSCSEAEARIAALAPDARAEAFLTGWTIKESYLKGIGIGLSRDPRTVEIALLPDDRASVTDRLAETGNHNGACVFFTPVLAGSPRWLLPVRCSQSPSINGRRRRSPGPVAETRERARASELTGDVVAPTELLSGAMPTIPAR
jgi:4'-phosphopantetheinyl transferase